jgi:hypothetical protein
LESKYEFLASFEAKSKGKTDSLLFLQAFTPRVNSK